MKKRIVLLSTIFVSFAQAGVSLQIEHPRNPSKVKDLYHVKCNGKCVLEMKTPSIVKGSTFSKIYREKINSLFEMKVKGDLPRSHENDRLVMYKIEVKDGKRSIDLVLGYPLSYMGEEYTKYANVISIIEDIKRNMKLELTEKK